MPKLKTNRGAAKRFRRTATGYKHRVRVQESHPDQEGAEAKRQLARPRVQCSPSDVGRLDRMLPKKSR